eukprot:GFUD01008451.1.p1 GENE.GFUD01008451.1~~GFUD01008451.1.p1  ORF type:complete len:329 (+),score=68.11 GFUD01008451.1:56-1042(+)
MNSRDTAALLREAAEYTVLFYAVINQLQTFLVSIKSMEGFPLELLEKILFHLPYSELGRLLTISRRWNMVIEGLLPSTRSVTIRGKRNCGKNKTLAIGTYSLYSSYKGHPVFVSDKTHTVQMGYGYTKTWLYLYKMEEVWYERCEQRFVSRPDSWRWYVSQEVGNLKINDGYLQCVKDSTYPPVMGSAWTWFVTHDYGRCGNDWPSHPDTDKIKYVDESTSDGGTTHPVFATSFHHASSSDSLIEVMQEQKANRYFPPFPPPPEYRTIVLHSYSGGVKECFKLTKDDVVLVLGPDNNGQTEVRKTDGNEGLVPSSCIKRECENCIRGI